jgi:hypothetical protein
MAQDAVTGPKNEPHFAETGAPEIGTDTTLVATYAAKVGNRRVGTTLERTNAAGKDVWEGLEWWDTTLKVAFIYLSSAWVAMSEEGWITPTLSSGVTNSAGRAPVKYRRVPGAVEIEGTITGSSGSGFSIFSLPAGFRPAAEVHLWCEQGTYVQVTAAGVVNTTLAGTKSNMSFSGKFAI